MVAANTNRRVVCAAESSSSDPLEQERSAAEEAQQANNEVSTSDPRVHSSTWASMLLELPLELAAFGSKTNPYWLRKRKRSHWWSRQHFPKVG